MSVSRQCVIDTTIDSKGESFRKQVTNEMFFRCPVPTRVRSSKQYSFENPMKGKLALSVS